MSRPITVTRESVNTAARTILARGGKLNSTTVREELGGGSYSTIGKHLAEWRASLEVSADPAIVKTMPPALQRAFDEIWVQASKLALEQYAVEREKFEQDRQVLEDQIERATDETVKTQNSLDQAMTRLADKTGEVDRLVASAETARVDHAAEIESHRRATAAEAHRAGELETQLHTASKQVGALESQVASLTGQVAAARERNELDQRFYAEKISSAQRARDESNKRAEKLDKDLTAAKSKIESQAEAIAQHAGRLEEAHRAAENARAAETDARQRAVSLETSLAQAGERLAAETRRAAAADEAAETLGRQRQQDEVDHAAERSRLEEQVRALTARLDAGTTSKPRGK